MLTTEIKALDAAFQELVKRRRGNMIRRGGAGSRDFEISVPFRGHEVLVGVESGWTGEDALFLFVRHARTAHVPNAATPFLPPRPAGVEEVVGRNLLPESIHDALDAALAADEDPATQKSKGAGGRAGGAGTATPSNPAGTRDGDPPPPASAPLPPRIPGFSVSVRVLTPPERLFKRFLGRAVRTDKNRPGWFHVELGHTEPAPGDLQSDFRTPLAALLSMRPLEHLSIGMTAHFLRIRRSPVHFEVEEIDHFVTTSLELLTVAIAMPSPIPAIEEPGMFLLDAIYDAGRGARCGVCGEQPAGRRVLCAKCLTPHHEDCWTWSGVCSIFGCGCTQKTAG